MSFLAAVLASAGTSSSVFFWSRIYAHTARLKHLFCFFNVYIVVSAEGEVEMTDLDKNVSELKHKITNLEFDIKEAMEQRYMKFAVVSRDAASLLDTAQSYSNQINNLITRIDSQVYYKDIYYFASCRVHLLYLALDLGFNSHRCFRVNVIFKGHTIFTLFSTSICNIYVIVVLFSMYE